MVPESRYATPVGILDSLSLNRKSAGAVWSGQTQLFLAVSLRNQIPPESRQALQVSNLPSPAQYSRDLLSPTCQ